MKPECEPGKIQIPQNEMWMYRTRVNDELFEKVKHLVHRYVVRDQWGNLVIVKSESVDEFLHIIAEIQRLKMAIQEARFAKIEGDKLTSKPHIGEHVRFWNRRYKKSHEFIVTRVIDEQGIAYLSAPTGVNYPAAGWVEWDTELVFDE